MNDHRLGYAPAMREDFQAPEWWEQQHRYPLGWPRREMEAACVNETRGWQPEGRYVTGRSSACMTKGDLCGLEPQDGPQLTPGEPVEPEVMVTLPNAQGCVYTHDLVRRPVPRETPTLSPAAEWPFAGQGWRNGDGGLGAQCERVRLEKLKAAEHERWLQRQQAAMWSSQQIYADKAAEEQRKRDAITACYSEKGCKA